MYEYGGDIHICLEAQTWLRGNPVSKSLPRHSYLATIAFIPDIYLWWVTMCCDCSIMNMWSLNDFINDLPLPSRWEKNQSCQVLRVRFNLHLRLIAKGLKSLNCNGKSPKQNLTGSVLVVRKNATTIQGGNPPCKILSPLEKTCRAELNTWTEFKKCGPLSENSSPSLVTWAGHGHATVVFHSV